jgi:hypothetical protein
MLPFKLEYVIEKALAATPSRRRALKELTGIKLSESQAVAAWPRLLEHKWYLSERLGRDVGLRVAAVDYFENIERPLPRFRLFHDGGLPPRLPMMLPFGERV